MVYGMSVRVLAEHGSSEFIFFTGTREEADDERECVSTGCKYMVKLSEWTSTAEYGTLGVYTTL